MRNRRVAMRAVLAVALAAATAGLSSCLGGGGRATGCTPPTDEPGLLDEYARDPVLAVRPAGARMLSLEHSAACHVSPDWPDDHTMSAVYLRLSVPHRYDLDALAEAYRQVVVAEGWQPAPDPGTGDALRYCKRIRTVTSYLRISAPDVRPEAGVMGPGGSPVPQPTPTRSRGGDIYVAISAAPTETACPVAG
ncbi:hypothetical protein [Plantactinospora sp. GCM10030261]|uniref:hypothetical protein n=1 Tax=Plantactinospora sp. GCM10030261 TaxID=3273420 RepID=UPI0036135EA7